MAKRKVLMLVDVDMEQANIEGLKFAFNTAFEGIAVVDRAFETIYDEKDNVSLDEVNVSLNVEGKYDDEYNEEEMKKISELAANDQIFTNGLEDGIDYAVEHLKRKGELK